MKRVYIFGYSNKNEFTKSQRIALENAGYTMVQKIFNADLYLFNWYENYNEPWKLDQKNVTIRW